MTWTDERVETLKRMWNEGQSASQIAKELGGVTRNAVIGKVHRLGLSNRVGPGGAAPAVVPGRAAGLPDPEDGAEEADLQPVAEAAPDEDLDLDPVPDAPEEVEDDDLDEDEALPVLPVRKAIIPAGQPLPPQPSANEISPEALAKVNEVEKVARRLTLMELTEKTCKWPVGDPATPNFWFCGLPVQQGKPYCEAHVGVAFQPMSARRDRRR